MSDAGDAGGGARGRGPRLPRWTRQEMLVLIEGKRLVESSGRGRGRGRGRGVGGGGEGEGGVTAAAEPTKWAAVAEYCRRHGVDRGPVQCRKRWSNLAGDYKKIREWERDRGGSAGKGEAASFWAMRNDARRERRLPGFFDREVFDILEGRGGGGAGCCRGTGGNAAAPRLDLENVEGKESKDKVVVIDTGVRPAARLFSSSSEEDDDDDEAATPSPTPTLAPVPPAVASAPISSEQAVGFFHQTMQKKADELRPESFEQATGTSKRKEPDDITDDSPVQTIRKRQRIGEDASGRATTDLQGDDASGRATTDLQGQLIDILDRSGRMVEAQLEAQNINSQLDREQRKDQVSSLLGVLDKVADALYRIADKL